MAEGTAPADGGVYSVALAGGFGRLWTRKPPVQPGGLLSVLRPPGVEGGRGRGRQRGGPGGASFTAVAFSARAETVATLDSDGGLFLLHVLQNRYARLDSSNYSGTALCFAPGNRGRLYAAYEDSTVRVYDVKGEARRVVATLKGHRCPVTHMSMSTKGVKLVTVSADCVVVWDTKTHTQLNNLSSGPYGAVQASYTPDDEYLVTSFKDDSLWVWDTRDFSHRATITLPIVKPTCGTSPHLLAFAVSADQQWLVAAGRSQLIFCWDLRTLQLAYAIALPLPQAHSGAKRLQFMPDNRTVAVLVCNGSVQFVDILKPAVTEAIESDGAGHLADAFSFDQRANHACLVNSEGEILFYDLFTLRRDFSGKPPLMLRTVTVEDLKKATGAFPLQSLEYPAASPTGVATPGGGLSYFGGPLVSASHDLAAVSKARVWSQGHTPRSISVYTPTRPVSKAKPRPTPPKPRANGHKVSPASQLGPRPTQSTVLSRKRLRCLLDAYGEYPDKYRLQIWEFLLEIPKNIEAHSTLQSKGTHGAFEELQRKYPLQNRALLARLQRVLSCTAYWTSLFGEIDYLPAMLFPFVKLFGANELSCFEVVSTLLTNWAGPWFQLYPHPPLPLLEQLEALLIHWDPELHYSMSRASGGCQAVSWGLMQTLYTEVLNRKEWLKVMDHIVTNDSGLQYFFIVSLMRHLRQSVMSASCEDIAAIFRRSQAVDINKVIRGAYEMRRETPVHLHLPSSALKPLRAGEVYPEFQGYCKKAVNYQIAERMRLESEEEALLRRRQLVKELEERTHALATREAAWAADKVRLSALETQRKAALRQQEEHLRSEMSKLDDKSKEERLRQINIIEATFRKNISAMQEQWQQELESMSIDIEHKRKDTQASVQRRMEDEAIKALEFQASQRMWAMQEERQRDAVAERMQHEVTARTLVADLDFQKQTLDWDQEDKQRIIIQQHEAARRARLATAREEAKLQQNVDTELFRSELERDLGIRQVQMERKLRAAAEVEAARTVEAVEAERIREAARHTEELEVLKAKADEDQAWYDKQMLRRSDRLAREDAARKQEARERAEAVGATERSSRMREAEGQLLERRRMLERQNLAEEREVARMLDMIDEERGRDRKLLDELRLGEADLEARLEHARRVATEQLRAEEDERSKFDELRAQLAMKRMEIDGEQKSRHADMMAQLTLERERSLMELDAAWRKNIARGEMERMKAETEAFSEARVDAEGNAIGEERMAAGEVARLRRKALAAQLAEDPLVAAAAAAAGAGLVDDTTETDVSSSPTNSSDEGSLLAPLARFTPAPNKGTDDERAYISSFAFERSPSLPPKTDPRLRLSSAVAARKADSSPTTVVTDESATTVRTTSSSALAQSRPPLPASQQSSSQKTSPSASRALDYSDLSMSPSFMDRRRPNASPGQLNPGPTESGGSSPLRLILHESADKSFGSATSKPPSEALSATVGLPTTGSSDSSVPVTPNLSAAAQYAREALASIGAPPSPGVSNWSENLNAELAALGLGPLSPSEQRPSPGTAGEPRPASRAAQTVAVSSAAPTPATLPVLPPRVPGTHRYSSVQSSLAGSSDAGAYWRMAAEMTSSPAAILTPREPGLRGGYSVTSTEHAATETRSTYSDRSTTSSALPTGYTGIQDYLSDFSMSESLLASVRRGVSGTPGGSMGSGASTPPRR